MDQHEVATAAAVVLARAQPLTTRRVREVLGYGSLRDIAAHLRALTHDDAPPVEGEPDQYAEALCLQAARAAPPTPTEEEPDVFLLLAQKIEALYDHGMDVKTIAAHLTAEGVSPLLGAAAWNARLVDRVLVSYAARQGIRYVIR
jgi:hypothetical protein